MTSLYEPAYGVDTQTSLDERLQDYLVKNWRIIEKGGFSGVVFFLDEFHVIQDSNPKKQHTFAEFISAMNEVQKAGYKYSMVLCGLPTLKRNVKDARSYAERMFKMVNISSLDASDAQDAITRPLEDSDCQFSADLVSELIKDSGGYPFFIQFCAKEVIDRVEGVSIGIEDYVSVRDTILKKLYRDFFDQRIESLSERQKAVLYTMSEMDDSAQFISILKKTGLNRSPLSSHLRRLEEKGLVYKHVHGRYNFALPLLKRYLQATRSRFAEG